QDRHRPGRRPRGSGALRRHRPSSPGRRGRGRGPPRGAGNARGERQSGVNEVHELKAIRGAITVEADEPEQVIAAARELTQELLAQNGLAPDDIVSAIFTATADLVSAFPAVGDRKSTRLNSSHVKISYAVFCLKKKKTSHM